MSTVYTSDAEVDERSQTPNLVGLEGGERKIEIDRPRQMENDIDTRE